MTEPNDAMKRHNDLADALYRESTPTAPAAPDPTAPAERVLFTHPVEGVLDRRLPEWGDATGANLAAQQALRSTVRGIATRLPGAEALVMKIAEQHLDDALAFHRSDDPEVLALEREDQVKVWNEELREDFRLRYGAKEGEELLERVRKFARAHEPLAKLLREHGLGSRPAIVEGLADFVFSSGYR